MSCATNELYKSIVVNGLCWCAGRWVGCREEGRGQMSTPPVATKGPLPPPESLYPAGHASQKRLVRAPIL